MARWPWVAFGVGIIAAVGVGIGVRSWRNRDRDWSDDAAMAEIARHPPTDVVIPDDVELVAVPAEGLMNALLVDVSVGTRWVRVHGRNALAIPTGASLSFPPEAQFRTDCYQLRELFSMVDWTRSALERVDAGNAELEEATVADAPQANVLVDANAPYEQVAEVLSTLHQRGLANVAFPVAKRRPTDPRESRSALAAGTRVAGERMVGRGRLAGPVLVVRIEGADIVAYSWPSWLMASSTASAPSPAQACPAQLKRMSGTNGHVDPTSLVAALSGLNLFAVLVMPEPTTKFGEIATLLSALDHAELEALMWLPTPEVPLSHCKSVLPEPPPPAAIRDLSQTQTR